MNIIVIIISFISTSFSIMMILLPFIYSPSHESGLPDVATMGTWYSFVATFGAAIAAGIAIYFAKKSSDTSNEISRKSQEISKESHILNIISAASQSANSSIAEIASFFSPVSSSLMPASQVRELLSSSVSVVIKAKELIDSFDLTDKEKDRIPKYFSAYLSSKAINEYRYKSLFNKAHNMDKLTTSYAIVKPLYDIIYIQYDTINKFLDM